MKRRILHHLAQVLLEVLVAAAVFVVAIGLSKGEWQTVVLAAVVLWVSASSWLSHHG